MLHLLSLEWMKFKNNAVINLFGLMFLITMPTVIFLGKEIKDVPPPLPDNSIFFTFPSVWEYMGYAGNWLVFFFLGFIIMFMITAEVGYKTMRQNIITGLTRNDYFLSKLYSVLVVSAFATIYYSIISLTIGVFHNEPYSFAGAFDNNYAIPRFFLMSLGYMSFGFMIAFLIRRSGIAIFTYITYIMFIEPFLKWVVHFRLTRDGTINYWPLNAIEDLMPLPFFKYAELIPREDLDFKFLLTSEVAMIVSSIYICIFIGVTYWNFIKSDV